MKLSFVIPFFNEEETIPVFLPQLLLAVDSFPSCTTEIIVVDDGSTDRTKLLLGQYAKTDARIRLLSLERNMGHQYAISAGLDEATGDAVIMMDGDGQHPVATLRQIVCFWLEHPEYEMVQAVRRGNQAGFLKDFPSRLYYLAMRFLFLEGILVAGASDFRVLSKSAIKKLSGIQGRRYNLRLVLAGLQLRTSFIEYNVEKRIAGQSKYSFLKMLRLGCDGLCAFSMRPLIRLVLISLLFFLVYESLFMVRCMVNGRTVQVLLKAVQYLFLIMALLQVCAAAWALCRRMTGSAEIQK